MNLWRITLKYMGWCPGVRSAAKFIPNRDIPLTPKLLGVTVSIFIVLSLSIYALYNYYYVPVPEGPLRIYIGKGTGRQVLYDYEFNESYDYSRLWGEQYEVREKVTFNEKLNSSEFASGTDVEVEDLLFETPDEVYSYMKEHVRAPNVIVGMARFLLNQTLEETYEKIWGEPIYPGKNIFGTTIGDTDVMGRPRGINYKITRLKNAQSGFEDYLNIQEGLFIGKLYGQEWIWVLRIDAEEIFSQKYYPSMENLSYKVQFTRYPRGYTGDVGP